MVSTQLLAKYWDAEVPPADSPVFSKHLRFETVSPVVVLGDRVVELWNSVKKPPKTKENQMLAGIGRKRNREWRTVEGGL